jgi:hypothetical protein
MSTNVHFAMKFQWNLWSLYVVIKYFAKFVFNRSIFVHCVEMNLLKLKKITFSKN